MTQTETEEVIEVKNTYFEMWKVLLHNDDHNTMDHVVKCLIKVFGMKEEAANMIMMEVHKTGIGLCAVEPKERAEFHMEQLISFSLTSTIEKN